MDKSLELPDICLNLFDGEGAGPGAAGEVNGNAPSAAGKGTGAAPTGSQGEVPAAGEQKPGEAGKAQPTQAERRKAYRALVEGDYKDLYEADTERIIARRFRAAKETEAALREQISKSSGILGLLAQKYRVDPKDPQAIASAFEADRSFWQQSAEEAGMSEAQYMELLKTKVQNAQLVEERELDAKQRIFARQRAQADAQYAKWSQEAEETRKVYPDFDLAQAVKDQQFASLLLAGTPVKLAYEVLHMDAIKAGVAQQQAKATEKQVVDNVRAKGARPAEAGLAGQSGFTLKTDPAKMSAKEIEEVARRVARGERISFG